MKQIKTTFTILTLFLLFFSCAQQNQPLSGGPKDTIPPKIISSLPKIDDTSFNSNKLEIKFDEYIITNNIDLEFFSSPPLTKKPKFKVVRKRLYITLKDTLLDSVTYTFTFGNSIVDLHENNKLKNFEYVFSTYDSIDYHSVSGYVKDASTFEPLQDMAVMLYTNFDDSIPCKQLPLYVTKTDSAGHFIISRIKKGNYKILALEDLNNNFIFNQDESKIAFADSLITPWSKLITTYDTLDSGTVIANPLIDTLLDTLRFDSIVINKHTEFYPDSLELLMFTEESAKQEIKRLIRDSKGLVKLFFVKPLIKNYLKLYPFELDQSAYFNCKIEKYPSGDSVYCWFPEKQFYNNDTLKFISEYYDIDTVLVLDTLTFPEYNYETDTTPFKIYNNKENISIYNPYTINVQNLITKIDTTKIHLFKIVDTVVADEKKQIIKVIRPKYDSLVFTFSRPIVDKFYINFDDYTATDVPAIWSLNATNDSVFCKITSHSLHNSDTLNITVDYDNLFFFNTIQQSTSSFSLPVTYQNLIKSTRKTQDTIILEFSKDLPKNIPLKIIDFSSSDYTTEINHNFINLYLKNSQMIMQDTLLITLHFFDMLLNTGKKSFYNDTVSAIYTYDHQKIIYKRRYLRSKILLGFKKSFIETPKIELLSLNPSNKWLAIKLNQSRDTLLLNITNQRVTRLNTMKLAVKYFDINQHNDTLWFADTLNLKTEQIADNNTKIVGHEKNLTIKKPINFNINQDSSIIRNYNITANLEPGAKYKLFIDSLAFTDIYSKNNDSVNFSFNVFSPDDFASLFLDIKNIWAVLDSVNIDTSNFYYLPKGQLILLILDENQNIYKTVTFNTDRTLKDAMFLPGTYSLKLFYDKNNNGYWDTGNYFKHRQPEKIFIYKSKLNLTNGNNEKVIWDLSKYK